MVRLSNTVERTMFFGAKPVTFERAKELRERPTEAEKLLWGILKKNQMLGLRFKHQHPISIFIADFYCHPIKLVIEVDGEIHNNKENKDYDANRAFELQELGITILRFTNHQVINDIDSVRSKIEAQCRVLKEK